MTGDAEAWARRIDPEIRAVLDLVPRLDLTDIPTARRERAELAARAAAGHVPPAPYGRRTAAYRVGRRASPTSWSGCTSPPAGRVAGVRPCSGCTAAGTCSATADQDDPLLQDLVARTGCVAVAVEWRRAPEHPYPAAVHDATPRCAGWRRTRRWTRGGWSSVGRAPAGEPRPASPCWPATGARYALAGQILVYPMLDDREVTVSSREVRDPRLWNHESNRLGWAAYLSGLDGDEVPAYAAPARAADLGGLPPTWIATGELDLFRDEDIEYASRLFAAGVPTELHVYPGGGARFRPVRCGCRACPAVTGGTATRRSTGSSESCRPGPRRPGNESATGFREVLASAVPQPLG